MNNNRQVVDVMWPPTGCTVADGCSPVRANLIGGNDDATNANRFCLYYAPAYFSNLHTPGQQWEDVPFWIPADREDGEQSHVWDVCQRHIEGVNNRRQNTDVFDRLFNDLVFSDIANGASDMKIDCLLIGEYEHYVSVRACYITNDEDYEFGGDPSVGHHVEFRPRDGEYIRGFRVFQDFAGIIGIKIVTNQRDGDQEEDLCYGRFYSNGPTASRCDMIAPGNAEVFALCGALGPEESSNMGFGFLARPHTGAGGRGGGMEVSYIIHEISDSSDDEMDTDSDSEGPSSGSSHFAPKGCSPADGCFPAENVSRVIDATENVLYCHYNDTDYSSPDDKYPTEKREPFLIPASDNQRTMDIIARHIDPINDKISLKAFRSSFNGLEFSRKNGGRDMTIKSLHIGEYGRDGLLVQAHYAIDGCDEDQHGEDLPPEGLTNGTNGEWFELGEGEYIRGFRVYQSFGMILGIRIVTNQRLSPRYGNVSCSREQSLCYMIAPSNMEVFALFGGRFLSQDKNIMSLGFLARPRIDPPMAPDDQKGNDLHQNLAKLSLDPPIRQSIQTQKPQEEEQLQQQEGRQQQQQQQDNKTAAWLKIDNESTAILDSVAAIAGSPDRQTDILLGMSGRKHILNSGAKTWPSHTRLNDLIRSKADSYQIARSTKKNDVDRGRQECARMVDEILIAVAVEGKRFLEFDEDSERWQIVKDRRKLAVMVRQRFGYMIHMKKNQQTRS